MKAISVITACAFACHAVATGGYAKDCQNLTLVDMDNSHVGLRASCKVANKVQCSVLDLWQCYGLDDGVLKPQDKGDLLRCRSCLLMNNTILECQCRAHRGGSHHPTSIDTNDLIINDGGVLKCFDNRATTPSDCAQKPKSMASSGIMSSFPLSYSLLLCIIAMIWA
ncbi:hypothetical protein F5Y11DRAFT_366714 [Daldinia sp. FL1419]|nr:hypothetical protein F5Y11DRAFT_366714 [Daldinia sp. FL1419]